jgi:hypothetical protein
MAVSFVALQLLVTMIIFSKIYNTAHVTSWHRYASSNSVTALCRLPGVGMGRTLQCKNEEALLS